MTINPFEPMTNQSQDPFMEGARAHKDGNSEDTSPYIGKAEHQDWYDGWQNDYMVESDLEQVRRKLSELAQYFQDRDGLSEEDARAAVLEAVSGF